MRGCVNVCACIYSSQIGNAVETREPPRDCGWKEDRKQVLIGVHPQQEKDVWTSFLRCLFRKAALYVRFYGDELSRKNRVGHLNQVDAFKLYWGERCLARE